jgi:hypothetical protein
MIESYIQLFVASVHVKRRFLSPPFFRLTRRLVTFMKESLFVELCFLALYVWTLVSLAVVKGLQGDWPPSIIGGGAIGCVHVGIIAVGKSYICSITLFDRS